jgi:hypothetical protein
MKEHLGQNFSRYFVAILARILLAAAFPKIGIAGFVWIALAQLLIAPVTSAKFSSGLRRFAASQCQGRLEKVLSPVPNCNAVENRPPFST